MARPRHAPTVAGALDLRTRGGEFQSAGRRKDAQFQGNTADWLTRSGRYRAARPKEQKPLSSGMTFLRIVIPLYLFV